MKRLTHHRIASSLLVPSFDQTQHNSSFHSTFPIPLINEEIRQCLLDKIVAVPTVLKNLQVELHPQLLEGVDSNARPVETESKCLEWVA
jgi:uncharacterized radical SAM superfamily Fe-S cluster-containing enzyme